MFQWTLHLLAQLQIAYLIAFNHSRLFEKINELSWYRDTLQQWILRQKFKPKISILEIGCATGTLSEFLANSGFKVTAVDISENMIIKAKRKYHDTTVNYLVADVFNLPFNSNEFDIIVSASVINIIPDKNLALTEMIRVCNIDGSINLLFPEHTFTHEKFLALKTSLLLTGFSLVALNTWNRAAPKLKKQELETLSKSAGLKIAETNTYLNSMLLSVKLIKI
jgi:ubiquinone/menaquinone biosynthesis C-methylase UbiE